MFFKISTKGKVEKTKHGAEGMSADQVLRAAVVKQLYSFTYEQLAFHMDDSKALSRFCRIGIADKGFGKSALNAKHQKNFSRYMGAHFPGLVGACQRRKHRERPQGPHRLYGG
jgi:hypothetical protein